MKTPESFKRKLRECRKQERVRNAAPKLLEALELLIADAEFLSARAGNDEEIESISKAYAAIAAARGE